MHACGGTWGKVTEMEIGGCGGQWWEVEGGLVGLGCSIHPSAIGGNRVFSWVIVIGGIEVAYMSVVRYLGWRRTVGNGVILTTKAADTVGQTGN